MCNFYIINHKIHRFSISSRAEHPGTYFTVALKKNNIEEVPVEEPECIAKEIKLDLSYIGRTGKEIQVTISEYIRETSYDVAILHSKLEGYNLLNDTKTKRFRQGIQLGSTTKHPGYIPHQANIPRRASMASHKR